MQKPTIFFDMDGVLIRSNDDHYHASQMAVEEHGYRLPDNARELNGLGWNLRQILAEVRVPEDVVSQIRAKRDEHYMSLLRKNARWMPGALETLTTLRNEGRHIAVITNSIEPYVRIVHDRLGIRHLVNVIITPDRFKIPPKPAPHGIQLAQEMLNVRGPIAFVGDNEFDTVAAHGADAFSCHFDPEGKTNTQKIPAKKFIKELQEVLTLTI